MFFCCDSLSAFLLSPQKHTSHFPFLTSSETPTPFLHCPTHPYLVALHPPFTPPPPEHLHHLHPFLSFTLISTFLFFPRRAAHIISHILFFPCFWDSSHILTVCCMRTRSSALFDRVVLISLWHTSHSGNQNDVNQTLCERAVLLFWSKNEA